MISKGLFY